MLATFMRLSVLCCVVILAACSETVSTNDTDDDLELRFAPLNADIPIEENLQRRFWVLTGGSGASETGFFVFNDLLWLRHGRTIDRVILQFAYNGKWNAWLLFHDWSNDEPRLERWIFGDYLFTDDGQFMMSGGSAGCFRSVVGRYYLRGDVLALRANGDTRHLRRYISIPDLLAGEE